MAEGTGRRSNARDNVGSTLFYSWLFRTVFMEGTYQSYNSSVALTYSSYTGPFGTRASRTDLRHHQRSETPESRLYLSYTFRRQSVLMSAESKIARSFYAISLGMSVYHNESNVHIRARLPTRNSAPRSIRQDLPDYLDVLRAAGRFISC